MIKIIVHVLLLFLLISCKKESSLVEVQIPDPEIPLTQKTLGNPNTVKANKDGSFQMKGLKYAYNDLSPFIDGLTMEIHYSKHHLGYANQLNEIIAGTSLETKPIEQILGGIDVKNDSLKNNAGGYYNHNLFFEILNPKSDGVPTGELATAITNEFGSFDEFQKQVTVTALKQFGSGWLWLVVDKSGKLVLTSTSNQDNTLLPFAPVKGTPIEAIDLWEHDYNLTYQNKPSEYVMAIFNILDWEVITTKYSKALENVELNKKILQIE